MELEEAKEKFIQSWGALGTNWGINRTMAQIHALLLISSSSLSAEEIMSQLNISRGNANMNIRALINWGLVKKELKPKERREYFYAEKDIWQVAKQVTIERRKRELKPVLKVLKEIKVIEGDPEDEELKSFLESLDNLETIMDQTDKFLEIILKADQEWFFKMIKKAFLGKIQKT